MDISERIKTKRNELGLTQEELANKVGVSFQAISKWENGKSLPDIEVLPVLSEAFNVSIDFLLTGQEFKKKEETKKDDIVAYFESFTKPYTLTDSGIRILKQTARDYPIEKVKECINIAFDQYDRNTGEIQKSQVAVMLSKLGGILYNESLPPVRRKIAQMVLVLSKRSTDHNKSKVCRQLKKDIADLLSWKTGADDREDIQIGILNEINETHLANVQSLWAAHCSVKEEINNFARKEEEERKKQEALQRKIALRRRVLGGYIRIEESDCPVQVQGLVNCLNENIKNGSDRLAQDMESILAALSLDMLGYSEAQDEFLSTNLEKKDFRTLAPRMYDYLGRYLGKDEHENLKHTIYFFDSVAAGDKKITYAFLDSFEGQLNRLLRKWRVLRNRRNRASQE